MSEKSPGVSRRSPLLSTYINICSAISLALKATPSNTWSDRKFFGRNDQKQNEEEEKRPTTSLDGKDTQQQQSLSQPLLSQLWVLVEEFVRHSFESQTPDQHPLLESCVTHQPSFFEGGPKMSKPHAWELVAEKDLPEEWDWRNIRGVNYLSWTVNQHIPQYCGSCWAQGPSSALADRFIIADPVRFANLALSPQAVLNCGFGGTCHGGNPGGVYVMAKHIGVSVVVVVVVINVYQKY